MKYLLFVLMFIFSNNATAKIFGVDSLEGGSMSFVDNVVTGDPSGEMLIHFKYCRGAEHECEILGEGVYNLRELNNLRTKLIKKNNYKKIGKAGAIFVGGVLTAALVSYIFPPSAPGATLKAGSALTAFMGVLAKSASSVIAKGTGFIVGVGGTAVAWKVFDLPSNSDFDYIKHLLDKKLLSGEDLVISDMSTEDYVLELESVLKKLRPVQ